MTKRSSGVSTLPDTVREQIKQRLIIMRKRAGRKTSESQTVSPSSLTTYEVHDPSTLRLGDMYHMSFEYGLSPIEFTNFLFGDLEELEDTSTLDRINVHLRALNPALLELVLSNVLDYVKFLESQKKSKEPTLEEPAVARTV